MVVENAGAERRASEGGVSPIIFCRHADFARPVPQTFARVCSRSQRGLPDRWPRARPNAAKALARRDRESTPRGISHPPQKLERRAVQSGGPFGALQQVIFNKPLSPFRAVDQ